MKEYLQSKHIVILLSLTTGWGRKRALRGKEKEILLHSQTVWLQQDPQHSASHDSRGQRLSQLMNIRLRPVALTKEKELFSLPEPGKFISGIYSASMRL